ncbi:TPA: restriction endonuclease subunit S [Listeria innocua]|uniref:restriction endonuclease subunit S n=1 Tax=Listeria innocua TaxID=1642 RepID=UPI0005F0875E|nr:restriction endonuclease subunit S [Listeria innocua]EAH4445444.1 restriction endonuclease subunit S [Listeria innocua]EMD1106972.1 restriction endonuclease subunit S [Listeria innocua]EMD1295360.1 restriction endonuclease subunit S [Listeria innocua]KJR53195.1 restriction endonuclease subunit S [Listeria innocua]HBM3538573.1 restriction endonuclease subunit S [Listeria innocua]
MSHIKKYAPRRRFEKFSNADDWEQRKLGEATESFDGKRVPIDSGLRISGEYPYYGATGIIDYVDDYIFDGEYVLLAEDGANITMRNYPVAYLTQGKFWLNNHAHIMRMIDGSNYFLVQVLEKIDYMKYNTGTAQPKLNSKVVKNIEFKLPHVEEQRKIGTFFKQLDNTIALHQRKLEKIKALKTAYLSEMFPAEGETKPKRRFAGFTDDWEQRKLCELAKITMGQSPEGVNYTDNPRDYVLVQGNADMQNGHVVPRVWTKQITKTAKKGDIILSVRAPVGDVGKTNYDVVLGRGVSALEGNEFIFQLLSKMKAENYWFKYSTGSTFESINSNEIKEAIVSAPEKQEQMKIGVFFKQLDSTITIHQRKLKKLQNIKKAYLNEMFI